MYTCAFFQSTLSLVGVSVDAPRTNKRMIQIMTHTSFCWFVCQSKDTLTNKDTRTNKRMIQIMTHASFYEACVIICIILFLVGVP